MGALKVISEQEADGRSVIVFEGSPGEAVFSAEHPADRSYCCGACGAVLLKGVGPGAIQGVVIKCLCGAFNDASI